MSEKVIIRLDGVSLDQMAKCADCGRVVPIVSCNFETEGTDDITTAMRPICQKCWKLKEKLESVVSTITRVKKQ